MNRFLQDLFGMQWMHLIMSQCLLIYLEAKGIGEILSKKIPPLILSLKMQLRCIILTPVLPSFSGSRLEKQE